MEHPPKMKLLLTSFAILASIASFVLALSMESESRASAATFSYRLTLPLIGTDSVSGAVPQSTVVPPMPATATPVATLSPTPTSTPIATATTKSTGQLALIVVQGWYGHVGTTLYGQYSDILANQSSGLISMSTAGQRLIDFKASADAYKSFLDGQGSSLLNASNSCNQARQSIALASGWLGLMAGWGGLILTGAGDYFEERQQASDSYFAMMTQALSLMSTCTGSVSGGSGGFTPPPSTATLIPTPTPTISSGGGSFCSGYRTTSDWRLQVMAPQFNGDLFDVVVTPLTDTATESSFKVRVYDPNFFSSDSSTKFFSFVGQNVRFHYGFDFFVSPPYASGLYEIELRVDFLRETSLLVSCY